MPVSLVEPITAPVLLGEGPHWDERQQALFFVSILECTIHKYVLATRQHTKTKLNGRVGFIVPVEGTTDQFVVGLERTFTVVQWDGAEGSAVTVLRELGTVDTDVAPVTRINDGKADPRGRIFAGTMGYEEPLGAIAPDQGSLYRVDGGGVTKLCGGIGISNGLAWDLQRKAFYYTDTFEYNIRRYDYDVDTGEISNPKHIFDLKKNNIQAGPDGTTIDSDGNLWVALFRGGAVIKIDPTTGKLLDKVPIPAHQVTSVTFGGPDYDILFVTTASLEIEGVKQKYPCGCTFAVTGLGVKGLPNANFKLS
ncbi:regucalcin-like [Pararge aegeria]|uniref:regucalcin-like n=1 Tax=Pararge aegeria TaxID=116150 RepID=UPI0019D3021B|nr:regucalcin-like [Pararge aegeria]XP_039754725.1 regucalcin-like [Pararge aegeria]